jgi:Protein of unknown function (DUF4242)
MTSYLVELYLPRARETDFAAAAGRAREAAAEMTRAGTPVACRQAIYLPEEETCFYLYEAASAELVARAVADAQLPVQRISQAIADPAPR